MSLSIIDSLCIMQNKMANYYLIATFFNSKNNKVNFNYPVLF